MTEIRRAGVLMPLSSFPGTLGIGDLGTSAYTFIDSLSKTGASIWQLLPLNPVGFGNSPYQTYSAFAGDEIYISIEALYKDLKLEFDSEPVIGTLVDYTRVKDIKTKYLKYAFEHFTKNEAYEDFVSKAFWLDDYTKFMALKEKNGLKSWLEWTDFVVADLDRDYHRFVQFVFFKQWMALKEYANNKGIMVVGDIPIYLGHDSADVYFNQKEYYLDDDGRPTLVAGVPPDFFSDEGQLWGNPIYRWDEMAKNDYSFWVDRFKWNQLLFDVIRLDHFRAFDSYWVIAGDSKTAAKGEWRIGPRHHFFDAMYRHIPNLNLVVEDLGDLRPEVLELRDDYELMGMKIIQFNLKPWEIEAAVNYDENYLAYTGTHDNKTVVGRLEELSDSEQIELRDNLVRLGYSEDALWKQIIHFTMGLKCNWVILPYQDLLGMDNVSRINEPGTVGSPNWEWKLDSYDHLEEAMAMLKGLVKATDR